MKRIHAKKIMSHSRAEPRGCESVDGPSHRLRRMPNEAPQKSVSRSPVAIDRRKFSFAVTAYIEEAQRIVEDSSRIRFEMVINDDLDLLPAKIRLCTVQLARQTWLFPIR